MTGMLKLLEELPGIKMHKAIFGIARRIETDLHGALGLSLSQFMVLMTVENKTECSQAEIAQMRGLTEAAVSRMVDTVMEKGWMTKVENPDNRRKHTLKLTSSGEEMFMKAAAIVKVNLEQIFAGLSEDERVTFDRIMDKILQAVYTKTSNYA